MPISPDFPYESHFVEVAGSRLHYIDEGEGEPILFLHGNPTSSYLWRNVIPHVSPHARCIALDLIGMGKSDKPAIGYRFFDHVTYVDGFIDALGLEKLTLCVHDWGSGLGFHWAHRHPDRVKGIAFMEAIVRPSTWAEFPMNFKLAFKMFRSPLGYVPLQVMNGFVNGMLPQTVVRKLGDAEMAQYRAPYPTAASRKPLRQWPCEIPIDGEPADVHEAVAAYSEWLTETEIPKLLLEFEPGAIIPPEVASWVKSNFPNLESKHLGRGIHFVQEDHPDAIGQAVAEWYQGL